LESVCEGGLGTCVGKNVNEMGGWGRGWAHEPLIECAHGERVVVLGGQVVFAGQKFWSVIE
jgi:hypothetical protein